jgi:hypothetical protein
MADLLALSFGIIPNTATRAAPANILTKATEKSGDNFLTFYNADTTWAFLKSETDPGAYVLILPGQYGTVARGPQSANNVTAIVGFATAPSADYIADGAAATCKITLCSKKLV